MKYKLKNKKIPKIKIKTKYKDKYGAIAWLVDKDEYLKKVANLRKRIQLKKFIPYDQFNPKQNFYCIPTKKQRLDLLELDEELETLKTCNWQGMNNEKIQNIEMHIREINDPKINFQKSIEEILILFGKGESFKNIVIKSVVCGKVSGNDLKEHSNFSTIKDIKRDRKWYWMYKKYSYSQIIKKEKEKAEKKGKKNPDLVRKSVESAIRRYKVFLGVLKK